MVTNEGRLNLKGGFRLFYRVWLPDAEPLAVLVFVHGLADHCGRYSNLVNHFVSRGYAVFGYDQRGHGKSDGRKGYIDRFSSFVNDLDRFIEFIRPLHPGKKIFLIGHSMGGTVAAAYALSHQAKLDGLVFSGALLKKPSDAGPLLVTTARILSKVVPEIGLYVIDADGISRDGSVVQAYVNDPLVYRGKIRARLGIELLDTMETVRNQVGKLYIPILIMHGTSDRLSSPENSGMLYSDSGSRDKTLKMYEGFYHEILNEPGYEGVLADIEDWLTRHV